MVFHGREDHGRIPYWHNAADVVCLPSLEEGCPNVVVEALACGTPVVASSVGGVPDLIAGAKQGQLVPPGDVCALANAIKQTLCTTRPRPTRDDSAIYHWDRNAQNLHAILNRACKDFQQIAAETLS